MDQNSHSERIWFQNAAENDLHLSGTSFVDENLHGTFLAEVTDDIDGEPRHPTTPFMGADEPSAELMLISPNGEEIFEKGQNITIEWYDELSEDVQIHLLKSDVPVVTIADPTPSNGSYVWTIPSVDDSENNLEFGSDYKISISSTVSEVSDVSDLEFTLTDLTAPGPPTQLRAGGASPSPWQNTPQFVIEWNNPVDYSTIETARFKLGSSPPASNSDYTQSLAPYPPLSITNGQNGSNNLYAWLVDELGNEDFNNYAVVELRFDNQSDAPNAGSFDESSGLQNDAWQKHRPSPKFNWDAPDDDAGVDEYNIYFGPDPSGVESTYTSTSPSVTIDDAPEGTSHLRVQTKDILGNLSDWVSGFIYKLDLSPPFNPTTIVENNGISNNEWQNSLNEPSFTWSGAEDPLSGISIYRIYWSTDPDEETYQTSSDENHAPGLSENNIFYLRVSTLDMVNNISSDTTLFTFKHDNTPPIQPVNFSADGLTSGVWQNQESTPGFDWDDASDALVGLENYLTYWGRDSLGIPESAVTKSDYTPEPAAVDTGTTYLRVSSEDSLGNVSEPVTGFIFRFDSIPPVVGASSPDTSTTGEISVSWHNALDQGGSGLNGIYSVQVKIGQGGWSSWLTNTESVQDIYPGAEHGETYSFRAIGSDNAGNTGDLEKADITATVIDTSKDDLDAPGSPIDLVANETSPSPWQMDPSFQLSWTNPGDASGISKTYYKMSEPPAADDDTSGQFLHGPPITVSATLENGQLVYVWLEDGAGNQNYKNNESVLIRWDETPPSGGIATSPEISSSVGFTVNLSGGEDGSGSGTNHQYAVRVKINDNDWKAWLTKFEGTSPTYTGETDSTYYFEAAAWDIAGNLELFTGSAECSTTIDTSVQDLQAPAKPIALTANGQSPSSWQKSSQFSLNWTNPGDVSGISKVYYKMTDLPANNSDFSGSFTDGPPVMVTATQQNGQEVYVWLEDGSGNSNYQNRESVLLRWDETAPTGGTATSPNISNSTSFAVNLSGGNDGSGSGINNHYDVQVKINDSDWKAWLTDFDGSAPTYTGKPDSTYYFEAAAWDIAGNMEEFSGTAECSTLVDTSGDATAPAAPLNLMASPGGWTDTDNYRINWTNPEDDANIMGAYYAIDNLPAHNEDGNYHELSGIKNEISNIQVFVPGRHMIYLWLKDIAGNADHNNLDSTILDFDNIPPEINNISPLQAAQPVNQDIQVSATILDQHSGFIDAEDPKLIFRQTGATNSTQVSFLGGTGTIPASSVTQRGVEFRLEVYDLTGNMATYPDSGFAPIQIELMDETGNMASVYHQGAEASDYRIFSVPFVLNDRRPSAVLEDDLGSYDPGKWKIFDLSGSALRNYTTIQNLNIIEPGKGFLLIVNLPDIVIDVGPGLTPKPEEYSSIALNQGWNLIGNPFDYDIPLSDLEYNNSTTELWYAGSNGWTRTNITHLKKWEGFAVHSDNSAQLNMKVGSSENALIKPNNNPLSGTWDLQVSAVGKFSSDLENFVGSYSEHNKPIRTIWHEPPRLETAVSLQLKPDFPDKLSSSMNNLEYYSTCYLESSETGHSWDILLQGDKPDEQIDLIFDQNGQLPAGHQFRLIDSDLKLVYDLQEINHQHSVKMSQDGSRDFKLLVGNQSFLEEQLSALDLVPTKFELRENFPNPFNATTHLIFGLPSSETIHLEVYTILGQKVRTLVDGITYKSGYHMVTWDGQNDNREMVASGLYIFHWRAGKHQTLRKGILIK